MATPKNELKTTPKNELKTTPKNELKTTGAKRGKVRGQAQVTPAAAPEAAQSPPEKPEELAPPVKPNEGPHEHDVAYQAGLLASQRGTPNRPPLGYSDAEVRAWYAGYKHHANPNSRGKVDDIEQGYRKDY